MSLLQTFPWVSEAWDFWRQILAVKAKVKAKIFNDFNSSITSPPFSRGPAFSKVAFTTDVPVEALPLALHSPCQIRYQVGFSFLNLIPTCSDNVSIFLLLPHLGLFSYVWIEWGYLFFIHTGLLPHLLGNLVIMMDHCWSWRGWI